MLLKITDYCQDRKLNFSLRYNDSKLSPFSLKIRDNNKKELFLNRDINLTNLINRGIESIEHLPILVTPETDQSE